MTVIRFLRKKPSPTGIPVPASGYFQFIPSKSITIEGDPDATVTPIKFSAPLGPDGSLSVDLMPNGPDWAWQITEALDRTERVTRHYTVPDSITPLDFTDLVEVDPGTLAPTPVEPEPAWYAYVDGLQTEANNAHDAAVLAAASIIPALEAAETAQAAAEVAETNAQASEQAANESESAAGTSAGGASVSAAAALASKNDAETARTAAQTARTDAESARTAAQTARTGAETARTGAETARTAAQSAQAAAETARDAAGTFHSTTVQTGAVDGAGHLILTRNDETTTDAGYVIGPPLTVSVIGTETGPDTPGETGAQGIQGLKGDPGGIVSAVTLGSGTDLNNIIDAGSYAFLSTTATLALNYPKEGMGGMLLVERRTASHVTQTVTPLTTTVRGKFQRSLISGWSTWQFLPSQRVSEAAGRAIYTWDDLNSREQIVYGDSGLRDIIASHGNGAFGALQVRRVGSMVHLWCTGWTVPSGGGSPFLTLLNGTGFRNPNSLSTVAVVNGSTFLPLAIGANFSSISVGGAVAGQTINFTISYSCIDPWPTTLPGIAYGAVPNL